MAAIAQASPGMATSQQQHSAHPFTCNTCQVAFRTSDLQRMHMQSDWHRYNLKRRVASLPPLAAETFQEKVLANKASAAATAAKASFERKCEPCGKVFFSEGAFVNHLGSQKHRILAAKQARGGRAGIDNVTETESLANSTFSLGEPMELRSTSTITDGREADDEEDVGELVQSIERTRLEDADADGAVQSPSRAKQDVRDGEKDDEYEHVANLQQCLFCNYISPTKDLSLHHMSRQHGFFIPERDFLVDLDGLITYLSETIEVLHHCLFCHKQHHTSSGVQTHMRDRGHCMIAYETEEEQIEVGEFYDFRSTYSDGEDEEDAEDDEDSRGGVSLGKTRATQTTYQNEAGEDVEMDDDADGWESDDSDLSSVPTDEITSVPLARSADAEKLALHRHHSHRDARPHKHSDGYHSRAHHTPNAVYHDDYELHLPSGRTAGHRSLRTYYKQNLRNYPSPDERAAQRLLENDSRDADDDVDDDDDEGSEAVTETQASSTTSRGSGRGRQLVSRANGGLGMVGVSDATKQRVKTVERREEKKAQRAENRYRAGNEKRANFQKHFRDPLLQ